MMGFGVPISSRLRSRVVKTAIESSYLINGGSIPLSESTGLDRPLVIE